MNGTQQERLHRPQPALVVTQGNSGRKYLPLEHTGITLGRARGCDIELNAPEVSALHCLITCSPSGLQIRDCNSRAGTRVNGQRIQDAPLHDGDVLHIGPFSFEVSVPGAYLLPPERSSLEAANKTRLMRLTRSRRRLVRLALGLRRRLYEKRDAAASKEVTEKTLSIRPEDLEQQADALREWVRYYGHKSIELENAERLLTADREALSRDITLFQEHVHQADQELKNRLLQVEAQIHARLQECEQRCRAMEQARLPKP